MAPIRLRRMRYCALATRASRSSREIGAASPVIGRRGGSANADAARGFSSIVPARAAAPRPKARRLTSGIGIGSAFLERRGVRWPRVDAVEPVDEVRPPLVEAGAVARGLEREAHHHVGGGEVLAGEPGA